MQPAGRACIKRRTKARHDHIPRLKQFEDDLAIRRKSRWPVKLDFGPAAEIQRVQQHNKLCGTEGPDRRVENRHAGADNARLSTRLPEIALNRLQHQQHPLADTKPVDVGQEPSYEGR